MRRVRAPDSPTGAVGFSAEATATTAVATVEGPAKERPGARSAEVVELVAPEGVVVKGTAQGVKACWHGACKRPATCEDRESKQGMIRLAHSR